MSIFESFNLPLTISSLPFNDDFPLFSECETSKIAFCHIHAVSMTCARGAQQKLKVFCMQIARKKCHTFVRSVPIRSKNRCKLPNYWSQCRRYDIVQRRCSIQDRRWCRAGERRRSIGRTSRQCATCARRRWAALTTVCRAHLRSCCCSCSCCRCHCSQSLRPRPMPKLQPVQSPSSKSTKEFARRASIEVAPTTLAALSPVTVNYVRTISTFKLDLDCVKTKRHAITLN